MQGVGSTYLTLTTIGVTVVGVGVIIGSVLGMSLAKTMKGKMMWGAVALLGGVVIWGSHKTREHIQTNKASTDKYGMVLLGLLVFGSVLKAVTGALRPDPIEPRGGFEPQVVVQDMSTTTDSNNTDSPSESNEEAGANESS